ncbi:lipid-A-disaccharide synthase-related protein [soil metagenome]
MPTVTFLSNGHGEDVVGALLAEELLRQRPNLWVQAFPTVDEGRAYEHLDIPILGPRRPMPSGGLTMHRLDLLLADLHAGFLGMTADQLTALRRLQSDTLVVVGDVYALLLSSLVPTKTRFMVQTLVSAHHSSGLAEKLRRPNRVFMEGIGPLERSLMRRLTRHVYVRDAATAAFLKRTSVEQASALGNPMLDGAAGVTMPEHAGSPVLIALLPGTRAYAPAALTTMLLALAQMPQATGLVAWAGGVLPLPPPPWASALPLPNAVGLTAIFSHGVQRVYVYKQRFADILRSAHLVLGTAGTANEQAAALGKRVVSFPVPPLYTEAFLRNQARLLGDALTVTEPKPEVLAATLQTLLADASGSAHVATAASRLGKPGGTRAIVTDLLSRADL